MSGHTESMSRRRTLLDLALDRPMVTSALLLGLILALSCGLLHWYVRDYVPFEEMGLPMPTEFLVTLDDMPEGWEQQRAPRLEYNPRMSIPLISIEGSVHFKNEQAGAGVSHTIGATTAPAYTAESFEEEVAFRAPQYDPLPQWPPLADWDYASPHADQYVLWVGVRGEPPHEKLVVMSVAQYGYYVSRLWLDGDPELVSPEDVQQLVLAADARFADLEQRLGE